ncbi:MAG: hypothetical protein DRH57_02375 [Candidatus Cloacimonadota bacterium]|nr:MAG: hypothetical protein DRH57_02375 [Candidatus Cloacimonadota bacterium]
MKYLLNFIYIIVILYPIFSVSRIIKFKKKKYILLFLIVISCANTISHIAFDTLHFPMEWITIGIYLLFINFLIIMGCALIIKDIELRGCIALLITIFIVSGLNELIIMLKI